MTIERSLAALFALLLLGAPARAEEPAEAGDKLIDGMSIVGNDEAPKSLTLVPWKGSDLGADLDLSRQLDEDLRPVDKDVFMRGVAYYEIRVGSPTKAVADPRGPQ